MDKIKQLVQDPAWQKIRQSLLGKWIEKPEWCCTQLHKYLGNIKTTKTIKLRIIMNYLVGSGFRSGKIKHECITKLRKEISDELKRRKEERILESIFKESNNESKRKRVE